MGVFARSGRVIMVEIGRKTRWRRRECRSRRTRETRALEGYGRKGGIDRRYLKPNRLEL